MDYIFLQIFLLMFGRNRVTLSILRVLIHYVYVSLIALMFPDMAQRQVCDVLYSS